MVASDTSAAAIDLAAREEQRVLLRSIAVTASVAAVGVGIGLWTGSGAILFDGIYSFVDVGMTMVSVGVSRLLTRGTSRRFQYGFWHFEPLLILANCAALILACGYAFLGALNDLFGDGRVVPFGPSAAYAVGAGAASAVMAVVMRRKAKRLGSQLVALDARGWIASAVLSLSLAIGFGVAALLRGGPAAYLTPYVDPAILALLALALIPLPARAVWRAGKDLFLVAPAELDAAVAAVAADISARHGFVEHATSVSRAGRAHFVEMGFVAGPDFGARDLDWYDAIRAEIAERTGAQPPTHWLTVEFTADRRWL